MININIKIAGIVIDNELILKFIRFAIVGAISFGINAMFTFLFHEKLLWDLMISTILALTITQIFQFILSKEWAFKYKHETTLKHFLYFFSTRIASLLIITIITELGTQIVGLPWIIAQLIGVIIGMIFNFITANWMVFIEPQNLEKEELKKKQILYLTYILLFLFGMIIGLISMNYDLIITSGDAMTWYIEARNIIAHKGLPYYNWFHTPIYNYYLAAIIVLFNDELIFARIGQIILFGLSLPFAYATFALKMNRKLALFGALLYMTSFIALFDANDIHQEALIGILYILFFYSIFNYEIKRERIWLWLAAFWVGVIFFTKEQAIIIIGIYIVYIIFWVKISWKDLLICSAILAPFIGAFAIVQYLQDWRIIRLYLGVGVEGSDSFLSRAGGLEFGKLAKAILLEPLFYIFGLIEIVYLVIDFVKTRKIETIQVFAFSVLLYMGIFVISRAAYIHLIYITFELIFLALLGIDRVYQWMIKKSNIMIQFHQKSPEKIFIYFLIPLFIIQLVFFIPNIPYIYNRDSEKIEVYNDIAGIVGNSTTYAEDNGVLSYYIPNLYGPYTWYNAYARNDFYSWNSSEVFRLTSMQNINDFGLKYFIRTYDNEALIGDYFREICLNGTLELVGTYTYSEKMTWWDVGYSFNIELYVYNP